MRARKEIEADWKKEDGIMYLILEVLLDIRELLQKEK